MTQQLQPGDGYSIDDRSRQLHQAFDNSVAILLPNIQDERYAILYTALSQCLSERGVKSDLYLTGDIPAQEESALADVAGRRSRGVVLVGCQPEGGEGIDLLRKRGVAVVTVERRVRGATRFLGFDERAIAARAASALDVSAPDGAALITGLKSHSFERALETYLTEALSERGVSATCYETDAANASVAAFAIASAPRPVRAVFTSSPSFATQVIDAFAYCDAKPPKIATLSSVRRVPAGDGVLRVPLNWKRLARVACAMVLGEDDRAEVILPPESDPRFVRSAPFVAGTTQINALLLDGPEARALTRLLPDFHRATGIRANVTVRQYDELYETIRSAGDSGLFDVLRMDVVWLEALSGGRLASYDPADPLCAQILSPALDSVRDGFTTAGGAHCAFPFTPNVQLLFYRRDLFEDAKLRRVWYEANRTELTVPRGYEDYLRLLHFFSHQENPLSPIPSGASVVSNTLSGIVCEFLPILFSQNGRLFDERGRPQLTTDAARNALEIYLEMVNASLVVPAQSWWKGAVDNFAHGETAMMNMFINHTSGITDLRKSRIAGRIGFAAVPGGRPLVGGGVLGVCERSKNREAALEFIRWACGERIARTLTLLGGLSACRSIYSDEELLELFPWLAIVPENMDKAVSRRAPKGILEYEAERHLGRAIKNAVNGVCDPKTALEFAQRALEGLSLQEQ